jgi:hypothetical protein
MQRGNINAEMTHVRLRLQQVVTEGQAAAATLPEPAARPVERPEHSEAQRQGAAEAWDNEGGSQAPAALSVEAAAIP